MIRFSAGAIALGSVLALAGAAHAQSIEDQQWPLLMIGAEAAADRGYAGAGVVVGVMDSGVQFQHPDLVANFSGLSFDPLSDDPVLDDPDGHGTHVAGIIAASRNGSGVRGVAYDAKFAVLRLSEVESFEAFDAVVGAGYAYGVRQNISIFSNSWGWDYYLGSDMAQQVTAQAMSGQIAGFRQAAQAGALIIFSTGNESQPQPNVQAGLPYYEPELQDHWLAVTAVNRSGQIASYANHCGLAAQWCLAAPGGDEPAAGQTPAQSYIISTYPTDSYEGLYGTSMAAPHVSGAAAIARQMYPAASAAALQRLLLATATDLGAQGVDPVYGWGLLNLGALARTRDANAASVFANGAWAAERGLAAFGSSLDDRLWGQLPAGGWASVIAAHADHDPTASAFGAEADTVGLSLGYDRAFGAGDLVGVALGWTRTELDEAAYASSATIEARSLGVYGLIRRGPVFAGGTIGLSQVDFRFDRRSLLGSEASALVARGLAGRSTTDGFSAFFDARLGLSFPIKGGEVRPFVQAAVGRQDIDGFAEDAARADIFALAAEDLMADRQSAGAGIQLAFAPRPLGPLMISADVSASHDMLAGDQDYAVPASLLGAPVPAALGDLGDPLTLSGGVGADIGPGLTASARGYWSASDSAESAGVAVALHARF